MKGNSIDIITLGCSKNLVDSEKLMRRLQLAGFTVRHDSPNPRGEIAIINTCGFIGDAKKESIEMILSFAQRKQAGKLKKLYVMGCLSERYLKELQLELPEVDKFYGKFNWDGVLKEIGKFYEQRYEDERTLTTPPHYAYLKISEGCNRTCSYCAIPIITGKHHSRPMEEILKEVRYLVSQGVREFQVIAQELTYYGVDLYRERRLPQLLDQMARIPGVDWIRLHYAYPANFPIALLEVMNRHANICPYLDIALQHISTRVLTAMRRHINKEQTYQLIETLRKSVPQIHLRTTLMVGHPGEGPEEFQELKNFVTDVEFDRMGAFAYSEEEGTYAARRLKDEVQPEVKIERLNQIMELQRHISAKLNNKKIGNTYRVIIDGIEGDYYVGRTAFDSPEVDPVVYLPKSEGVLKTGEFYEALITSSTDYDLYGKLVSSV